VAARDGIRPAVPNRFPNLSALAIHDRGRVPPGKSRLGIGFRGKIDFAAKSDFAAERVHHAVTGWPAAVGKHAVARTCAPTCWRGRCSRWCERRCDRSRKLRLTEAMKQLYFWKTGRECCALWQFSSTPVPTSLRDGSERKVVCGSVSVAIVVRRLRRRWCSTPATISAPV
jgi:hypothetical protein